MHIFWTVIYQQLVNLVIISSIVISMVRCHLKSNIDVVNSNISLSIIMDICDCRSWWTSCRQEYSLFTIQSFKFRMGIFDEFKPCEQPVALNGINEYLNYTAKLQDTYTMFDFTNNFIESNHSPRINWKSPRRNRVHPNERMWKRYALNQADCISAYIQENVINIAHRKYAADEIIEDLRTPLMEYFTEVSEQRA